jgi:hypothetical protein
MRVKTFTTSRYSFQSNSAKSVNAFLHEAREIDRAEQAGAIGRQRLLAAVVRVESVGIELVDARNLHVVHVFHAIGHNTLDSSHEALAIESSLVTAEQARETRALDRVGEADELGEPRNVFAGDHEFVLRTFVHARGDAETQQHALRTFEQIQVRLREAHRHALQLVALHAAIVSNRPRRNPR